MQTSMGGLLMVCTFVGVKLFNARGGDQFDMEFNCFCFVGFFFLRRKGLMDSRVFDYMWLTELFPQGSIHSVNVLRVKKTETHSF